MLDGLTKYSEASFASDRLRELMDGMRLTWKRSIDESYPNAPIDIYVVDADVVHMFMNPSSNHSYGALLRYDVHSRKDPASSLKELEGRLVEFLGNLIFFQLRPNIPFMMLPGHAEELEKILIDAWDGASKEFGEWKLIKGAIVESGKNTIKTSESLLSDAAQAVSNSEGEDAIQLFLNEIYRNLKGKGAIGSLFRFDALSSAARIVHVDHIFLEDENGNKRYLPPPLSKSGKYLQSVERLTGRLNRAMLRISKSDDRSKKRNIWRDAQALAHLAWLNEVVSNDTWFISSDDGVKRKVGQLVLISGSHLLPQAIEELDLRPLRGCVVAPISFMGHRLMDEYFRKGGGNLVDVGEGNQGNDASALINFLDSMRDILDSAIETRNYDEISRASETVRGKHSKLAETWQARQLFGKNSRMDAISAAIKSLESSGRSLDALQSFLEKLSVSVWQSFARTLTALCFESVAQDNTVQRNIPPVVFRHFPEARNISGRLYKIGDNEAARDTAKRVLTAESILALQREEPNHYTEFVCMALVGLVFRRLRSAEGCAELAWSIAKSNPSEGSFARYVKGDEALYLLAHIIRLRARRIEHLDRALESVNNALEVSRSMAAIDGVEVDDDIRIVSERFSICCHQRYFEGLGSVGRWNPNRRKESSRDKLGQTFEEGLLLLKKIGEFASDQNDYLFQYVKQQVLVNLAQLALFMEYPPSRQEDEKVVVFQFKDRDVVVDSHKNDFNCIAKQLIDQCCQLEEDDTGTLPRPSLLSTTVAAVAGQVFLEPNANDLQMAQRIEGWLRLHPKRVATIDVLRFSYLESVLLYKNTV